MTNRNIFINKQNVKSDLDNWYLKIWGSKEYRQIGKLCMKYDPIQQQKRFPKLFFWMQMMCQAFLNRGIPIHQVQKKYLYRGVNSDFDSLKPFYHNSWISTTEDINVAKKFSKGVHHPRIFIFPIENIDREMIVLPITNSYEKEILFPPGIIFPLDKYIDAYQIVQFQPDFKLFQYYLSQPLKKPFQLGGKAQMIKDMEGKILIIYRKIEGREIDIISYRMIPNHIEDYDKWFFENVRIPIHRIDSYTNIIPEVMDIEYELNGNTTSKRKDELMNNRLSYYADTLIYDPKTKEIYGFPQPLKKPINITNALHKYQQINSIKL